MSMLHRHQPGPHAAQLGYFQHIDECFSQVEAAYDDAAWERLSNRQQLAALGLGDRRLKYPCEGNPEPKVNAARREQGRKHEDLVLEAYRADPTATGPEMARQLGLTLPTIDGCRLRLLRRGCIRRVEKIGFSRWRYEVLV